MTASRKTDFELVRKRALAIHKRNGCPENEICQGPTYEEREQAAREIRIQERQRRNDH